MMSVPGSAGDAAPVAGLARLSFHGLNLAIALVGAALLVLGARLAQLGGSPWYLFSGIVMIAAAVMAMRRRPGAPWLYWGFVAANLAWSLWEAGPDGWALLPRNGLAIVLGLAMLTPWYRRGAGIDRPLPGAKVLWPALLLLAAGCVAAIFWADRTPAPRSMAYGAAPASPAEGDWLAYGGDRGGARWSPLRQITAANVAGLEPVWTFHGGTTPKGAKANFQVNPLKVGDLVYICTGYNDIVALDAETGKPAWRFRARVDERGVYNYTCRGVTYFRVPGAAGACAERIYTATVDARLIAVDARTGRTCAGFGRDGQVSLLAGMGRVDKGYYYVTSPPALVRGKLVLGGWVTDGQTVGEPAGVIRAFDAVTGEFAWAFDPGRPDDHAMPPAGGQFTQGTPNSWAPMSADEGLGLVYVPTGNATPDYFGGHRTANDDRFSSSVVALDARTGAVRWTFQTVHHDLWDYDAGSQPSLVDLPGGIPALVQPTKRGQIFVLDRRTGRPVFPVEERPVPQAGVPGERLSPTQPYSALPSFAGPAPTEKRMWGITAIDQALCRIRFREARFDGEMTPLGTDRPTITWPGFLGGIDWGSIAVDKQRGLLLVNSSVQVPNYNRLLPRARADAMGLKPMSAEHMSDVGSAVAQAGVAYAAQIAPFLSPLGVPCPQPPYGLIGAIDLRTGKLVWRRRLGTARDSGPLGIATRLPIPLGTPNLGGAVATAGGVTFIGATQEHAFRAFETATGRELWKARLPAGAHSSPTTYWSSRSGRQFVIIAADGRDLLHSGSSDALIAYALPRR